MVKTSPIYRDQVSSLVQSAQEQGWTVTSTPRHVRFVTPKGCSIFTAVNAFAGHETSTLSQLRKRLTREGLAL